MVTGAMRNILSRHFVTMKRVRVRYAPANSLPVADTPTRGLDDAEYAVPSVTGRPDGNSKRRWTNVRKTPRASYAKGARWEKLVKQVREDAGHCCRNCGKSHGRTEVDHIIPVRAGGDPYDIRNLQLLCRSCHYHKTMADKRKYPELVSQPI